jgi:hypothetical protein
MWGAEEFKGREQNYVELMQFHHLSPSSGPEMLQNSRVPVPTIQKVSVGECHTSVLVWSAAFPAPPPWTRTTSLRAVAAP